MTNNNFLTGLEYFVLIIVMRLNGSAYGVPIFREICEITEKDVAFGAIYKVLKSLHKKGFVTCTKGEATKERGGRAKTYYKITGAGINYLNEYSASLERINTLQPIPGAL